MSIFNTLSIFWCSISTFYSSTSCTTCSSHWTSLLKVKGQLHKTINKQKSEQRRSETNIIIFSQLTEDFCFFSFPSNKVRFNISAVRDNKYKNCKVNRRSYRDDFTFIYSVRGHRGFTVSPVNERQLLILRHSAVI